MSARRHPRTRRTVAAVALAAASLAGTAVATGSASATVRPGDVAPPVQQTPFAASSFANTSVPAATALDPNSAAYVANLTNQVATYSGGAAFNLYQYNAVLRTVPATTPLSNVGWDDCQHKGKTDPGLIAAFTGIPIPADLKVNNDTDRSVDIYQPSTDTLWELWKATQQSDGSWHACYGGKISPVSSSTGIMPFPYGASASGLPAWAGEIKVSDVQSGSINHVMALELPLIQASLIDWPANRTDGKVTDPTTPMMGQRFRLDPTLDLSTLRLNATELQIAKAAQTYGFVITDTSGTVALLGESPIPWTAAGQPDPWKTLDAGIPSYNVMKNFPWSRLQALPTNYGAPQAPAPAPATSTATSAPTPTGVPAPVPVVR